MDDRLLPLLVDRLVAFQWPDGGWNCDKRPDARGSSVQETLLPLRGLANGAFPVEWTNVRKADRIETRGTYADWDLHPRRKGNAFVTVDALYVIREAGRNTAS